MLFCECNQAERIYLYDLPLFEFIKFNIMSDVTYIEDFYESSDQESDDEPKAKKQRRTPISRIWLKKEDFDDPTTAENFVNEKVIWKKSSCKSTFEGYKVEYRCTAAKYRVNECPSGIYLLYHADSTKVSLFETRSDHANHVTDPSRGLSAEMKLFVKEKFEDGIRKPNEILNVMRMRKMTEPCKSKLVTYLKQLRTEILGPSTISAPELRKWCAERNTVPTEDDEAFVLQYNVVAESSKIEEQDVQIVISTKRLLRTLKMSPLVQIDASYKVIWHGYPIFVVGTSDADNKLHPFALAVCKGESGDDFAFVFNSLHKYAHYHHGRRC